MSYATSTSIILLLPGLPQTSTAAGYSTTAALIESHISRADNIVNGKVARRYDVSQFAVNVPPMLKTLSEDIASYFSYRSLYSSDNQNFNEWTDKFKDALAILDELNKGNLDLVDSSGNLIAERESTSLNGLVDSNTIDTQSFFDVDEPMDWKFDTDMTDTVAGKR